MVDVLRKELAMGFDEAVERVERIVNEAGLRLRSAAEINAERLVRDILEGV